MRLEPSLAQTRTRRIPIRIISEALPFVLGAALTAVIACAPAIAAEPEHVDIPDGELTLHASLYRPDGAGPFPAVVALHDCSGLVHHRPITETRHYIEWARLLEADGFIVLFPDSFGSRGIGPQCHERNRKVRASRERVSDANAARHWLQAQSYVKLDHVSVLGWSSGGTAALWTVRPTAAPRDGSTDFRSAVTFYPSCRRLHDTAWSARVPTLILVGAADDWTPASVCQQMVAGARDRSARVQIVVYPGAQHQFDRANSPISPASSIPSIRPPAPTRSNACRNGCNADKRFNLKQSRSRTACPAPNWRGGGAALRLPRPA
jgi:dienelactone hydrolase